MGSRCEDKLDVELEAQGQRLLALTEVHRYLSFAATATNLRSLQYHMNYCSPFFLFRIHVEHVDIRSKVLPTLATRFVIILTVLLVRCKHVDSLVCESTGT